MEDHDFDSYNYNYKTGEKISSSYEYTFTWDGPSKRDELNERLLKKRKKIKKRKLKR